MQHVSSDSDSAVGFRVWEVAGLKTMSRAHTHPDMEINFVASGFIEYLFGGVRKRVSAGAFVVFWGGIPHQLTEWSREARGIWITIPLADFLRWPIPGQLSTLLIGGGLAQGESPNSTFRKWRDDFESNDPARRAVLLLELEASLHRLALALNDRALRSREKSPRAGGGHLAKVAGFIAAHYAEPLDLPQIAQAAGLNPKYLARIFRAQTGLTVHVYLTRLRLAHAQRLLANTEQRVVDVALQSGFGSLASFYAAFAKHCGGGTPHAYRRQRDRVVNSPDSNRSAPISPPRSRARESGAE
ncbi:helix-turn-helix domain-containing protein [Oleiharenicola lentus]|uniref:helix-turn-helix domain-containing protein n=1 Tax=Oleiharenicola lentus TaxID=2508720 RepID=UPI003F672373